jgi:hypothetical protein
VLHVLPMVEGLLVRHGVLALVLSTATEGSQDLYEDEWLLYELYDHSNHFQQSEGL